jgi:hypothetical protein
MYLYLRNYLPHGHETCKVCLGSILEVTGIFLRSRINKQGIYVFFVWKNIDSRENIVQNNFLLLSAWENVSVIKNIVYLHACKIL